MFLRAAQGRRARVYLVDCIRSFPVHLLAVADAHNEDAQSAVLDAGDNAIVANPVLPEDSQLRAFEGFANAARVVKPGDTVMQKSEDPNT